MNGSISPVYDSSVNVITGASVGTALHVAEKVNDSPTSIVALVSSVLALTSSPLTYNLISEASMTLVYSPDNDE